MGTMFFKGAAVAAALALGATGATATTISPQNPNDIFDGGGFRDVTVNQDGDVRSVSAGGFRVTEASVGNFIAWCANLATTLALPSNYAKRTLEEAISDQVTVNRIHALFNAALPTLNLDSSTAGHNDSAGFQLALWNILYDTDFSVSTGPGFSATGSPGARDRANEFLAAVEAKGDEYSVRWYNLTFWQSKRNSAPISQDLISAAPIPLPAAAWMLIAALGAAAAVSRRRRDA